MIKRCRQPKHVHLIPGLLLKEKVTELQCYVPFLMLHSSRHLDGSHQIKRKAPQALLNVVQLEDSHHSPSACPTQAGRRAGVEVNTWAADDAST